MKKAAELSVVDLDRARASVDAASSVARVSIREIGSIDELREAADLYASVWLKESGDPIIRAELLRALSHTGNYVAGAYSNGRLLGALTGFLGRENGRLHLHSHILGVLPDTQSKNIGFALKQHQRWWCLERNIETVTWTFDPLVARNAYFNMTKLGADAAAYFHNFYGAMNDSINAGDESDRLLVEWKLTSPKADVASYRGGTEPDVDELQSFHPAVVLDEDERGHPVILPSEGRAVLLLRVPEDIVTVRTQNPELAWAWRRAQRQALGGSLDSGYQILGVTRSGWYVLERNA